jgi:hypothetical protein
MTEVSLADQLACAKRELQIRTKVYPKWVQHEQMTERAAQRELLAMTAIVHTLQRLVDADAHARQPRLWRDS